MQYDIVDLKFRQLKKSVILTLIERLPRILLSFAVLLIVFRANPGDLPKIAETLTKSEVFAVAGWIVAGVVIVVAAVAVWLYVKLKPK